MHTAHAELQTSIAADPELSAARQPLLPNSSDHPTALWELAVVDAHGFTDLCCVDINSAAEVMAMLQPQLAPTTFPPKASLESVGSLPLRGRNTLGLQIPAWNPRCPRKADTILSIPRDFLEAG